MLRRLTPILVLVAVLAVAALLALAGRSFYRRPSGGGDPWVRMGQEVFEGRGRCASCHGIGGKGAGDRGPDLGPAGGTGESLTARAATRVPGLSVVEYLVQSLYDPNAFVVAGYPPGLMSAANESPISLTDADIAALVRYMLSLSPGAELPAGIDADIGRAQERYRGAASARRALRTGKPELGKAVFARMRCASCHSLRGVTTSEEDAASARLGPSLTGIGALQDAAYLQDSVWFPDKVVVRGSKGEFLADDKRTSKMPSYQETLTRADLAHLVAFLAAQK